MIREIRISLPSECGYIFRVGAEKMFGGGARGRIIAPNFMVLNQEKRSSSLGPLMQSSAMKTLKAKGATISIVA
jgi:hypothetical protein